MTTDEKKYGLLDIGNSLAGFQQFPTRFEFCFQFVFNIETLEIIWNIFKTISFAINCVSR